jgi:hypothetical protein
MTRFILAALGLVTLTLTGCDNRTRDAVRWEQIADAQNTNRDVQPWSAAKSPWSNDEYRSGLAW